MIRTRLALSVLACVGVAGTGCASAPMTSSPAVNWQNHETIRTCIGDPDAFKGGPMPVCHGYQRPSEVPVPVTDVHYVTIQLERIYFRDLPEWTRDADVSISVSVKGLLPGGREYRRVLDIAHVKKEAFLQLQNVSINFPMKYENRVTSLEFRIEEIDDIKAARKWFDAGKKLLKGVQSSPLAGGLMGALLISEITEDVATVVLDQLSQNDHVFALEQVDFLPVTATTDPNPQLLFTPGRFMVVAVPPTDAYPQMHSLYPGTYPSLLDRRWLMEHTQYDGGKLTMKDGGGSYLFTPYVSFNFAILKRYAEVNPAVSHFKKASQHIDLEDWDEAQAHIALARANFMGQSIVSFRESIAPKPKPDQPKGPKGLLQMTAAEILGKAGKIIDQVKQADIKGAVKSVKAGMRGGVGGAGVAAPVAGGGSDATAQAIEIAGKDSYEIYTELEQTYFARFYKTMKAHLAVARANRRPPPDQIVDVLDRYFELRATRNKIPLTNAECEAMDRGTQSLWKKYLKHYGLREPIQPGLALQEALAPQGEAAAAVYKDLVRLASEVKLVNSQCVEKKSRAF